MSFVWNPHPDVPSRFYEVLKQQSIHLSIYSVDEISRKPPASYFMRIVIVPWKLNKMWWHWIKKLLFGIQVSWQRSDVFKLHTESVIRHDYMWYRTFLILLFSYRRNCLSLPCRQSLSSTDSLAMRKKHYSTTAFHLVSVWTATL